jgi:hypothetical protein
VHPDSDLDGGTLGDVDATVVAVRSEGSSIEAIPPRSRSLAAGDELYVIARPERLREISGLAAAPAADGGVDGSRDGSTDGGGDGDIDGGGDGSIDDGDGSTA